MTDATIVVRKLAHLREHLQRAARRRSDSAKELAANPDQLDALALSVMVIVQESIDIAFHIVVDEGWGLPGSYAESFDLLAQNGVIDAKLATDLGAAARLRNRIAHGYATLDAERLWAELPAGLAAFEAYSIAIAQLLSKAPSE